MRVLKDCHARTAIEVRVGSKWTTIIVLNQGPHFEQVRNDSLGGTWKDFDYDVKVAAKHFLDMQRYFEITDACKQALQSIIEGTVTQTTRPPSIKTLLRDMLVAEGKLPLADLMKRLNAKQDAIQNALSDLKNPKYCGSTGVFLTQIKEGVVYVRA